MKYKDMKDGTVYSVGKHNTKFMKIPNKFGHNISLVTGYITKEEFNDGTDYIIHRLVTEAEMLEGITFLQKKYKKDHTHEVSIMELKAGDKIEDPLRKGKFLTFVSYELQELIINVEDHDGDVFPVHQPSDTKVMRHDYE